MSEVKTIDVSIDEHTAKRNGTTVIKTLSHSGIPKVGMRVLPEKCPVIEVTRVDVTDDKHHYVIVIDGKVPFDRLFVQLEVV